MREREREREVKVTEYPSRSKKSLRSAEDADRFNQNQQYRGLGEGADKK